MQRVHRARVAAGGREAAIGPGLVVLAGLCRGDHEGLVAPAARRLWGLRVFPDGAGRMARSLADTGGELLVIPNFTLCADTRRGRRPDFSAALPPPAAEGLFDALVGALAGAGHGRVAAGWFGAHMALELVNDGPVTLVLQLGDPAGEGEGGGRAGAGGSTA